VSVITDAEAWGIVQRLDAKAPALLKPMASQLGLDGLAISGQVVELVWDSFSRSEFGRDHYPYSAELEWLTVSINRMCGVVLEQWHVWGLLHRVHKKQKNWGKHRGQGSPYLEDLHKEYGVSAEQMKAMGAVPMRLARGLGDDVAMTHVITRATNQLSAWGNWGDWFDDRFTFNAMLACRKAGPVRGVFI
jgi:hypothetical protein